MIVTFISQCEKKALSRTRRVLDAFANRIGDNTWQTVITEEGLVAVKKLLRETATKSTAVACHRIKTRTRSELQWIVGKRSKFNNQGIVPVNWTKKNLAQNKWENDWHYLPLIKTLVAIASLFHDWGKASVLFQEKLNTQSKKGDPLRHEWVSCLLLKSLVLCSGNTKTDDSWLNLLMQHSWDENILKKTIKQTTEATKALDQLPPVAGLIAWLIVSHHRLPDLQLESIRNGYKGVKQESLNDLLKHITAEWGYKNEFDENDYNNRVKECFKFEHGLLSNSPEWCKQVQKWATRLLQETDSALKCLKDESWRVVLHHARLCLMLGDHYYSSCDKSTNWKYDVELAANTDKHGHIKQKLDEHLVYVSKHALEVSQSLNRLSEEMDYAYDIQKLKQKSMLGYEWQDSAANQIKQFNVQNESRQNGWFIVNMASTGKGKTIANAKIMRALSYDGNSLRYILALGLRTLTLQTGDVYRNDLGLANDELAVLIGSKVVQELHHREMISVGVQDSDFSQNGSESIEELLDNELDYEAMPHADFMNTLFSQNDPEKNKAFLYKPVLVCTIDHIIAATETRRGGKYILPCLRLLSSDLVIDEVDEFNAQDLVAIARLVHLAGMLGRKVMISSATIPPSLAEGLFNAYQLGWKLYCKFKQIIHNSVIGMWVDEFNTNIDLIADGNGCSSIQNYKLAHHQFVTLRVKQLTKQLIKHKAYIIKCDHLKLSSDKSQLEGSTRKQYFELIKNNIQKLHLLHNTIDAKTNKKVSFGVVRIANISPCVELTKYLLNAEWDNTIVPRVMAYHSRQILLLRSEQEHHLDIVLKRKEKKGEQPLAFTNIEIRKHLDSIDAEHVIFILVATPVEEVGRDHDFDWAVVEPSSYRSIIQLSGRVLRHRKITEDIRDPNIALMQYNLKGLDNADIAFAKPGFEMNNDHFRLETKDIEQLIDVASLAKGINSIPRIQEASTLHATRKLADLEHVVTARYLTKYDLKGANEINGWLNETWFLTALPQRFNSFRQGVPNIRLYATIQDNKLKPEFCEKDESGKYIKRDNFYKIAWLDLNILENQRLWLNRDYGEILRSKVNDIDDIKNVDKEIFHLSIRYGEIMLPEYYSDKNLIYSDQFGLIDKNSFN